MENLTLEQLDQLKEQAKSQINAWLEFIEPKRETFRQRLSKYIDQDKPEDKIWVNTIYSYINLWIAIRQSDKANVLFTPRKFWDEEYSDNLTSLAEFDYDEMEMSKMDYAKDWDSLFFWYAIKTKSGWDDIKQVPLFTQEDPLTWIPDPQMDYIKTPRYHFFEKEMLKSEMTEEYWFDEDVVAELTNEVNEEIQNNRNTRNDAAWVNHVDEDVNNDFYVSIYDGYTYFEWDLYVVTLSNNRELLRAEKVDPVRAEEKKSWFVDMRACVQMEWFSPQRWNPCWVSLIDLIIDKQTANSQLLNLRLIDAKFSTFWQTNLVNTDIIKNTTELTKPSVTTKWVWVNAWGQSLSNAVYPVPRQSIMQDSYNVTWELSKQMQLDTWISENSLWVAQKWITLWEAQQVQSNANIRLALWITIANWWARDFWDYIWLRSYEEYFSSSKSKVIRVANWFGVNIIEIRKDDFLWGQNPDIMIESKKKVESEREKMKTNFLAMLPYFTEDPSKPTVVKNVALRYSLKLQWMSKEMVNLLTYDPNEEKAKSFVHLLNADDKRGAEIDDLNEDHLTFLVIFESAIDTEAKRLAIQKRREAYIISWQASKEKEWTEWWTIRQTQAQNTAAALSNWNKSNIDLWQVAQW